MGRGREAFGRQGRLTENLAVTNKQRIPVARVRRGSGVKD